MYFIAINRMMSPAISRVIPFVVSLLVMASVVVDVDCMELLYGLPFPRE
jgi:hypothetical protein